MPKSVGEYFQDQLGEPLEACPKAPIPEWSPYHPGFHVETACGIDCKNAINAAKAFIEHIRCASGSRTARERSAVETARSIVRTYVYG